MIQPNRPVASPAPRRLVLRVVCLCLAAWSWSAASQTPPIALPPYNTVDLQVEVQREVANDLMNATLRAELNNPDAAKLAGELNRAINEALDEARNVKSVRARSGGYQTFPVYDRSQRITGWRGRADVRLESGDFLAASALIAKLQSRLQLASLAFAVAPETRRRIEKELIAEAVAAFRERADTARAALGGRAYKIRRLSLGTGRLVAPQPAFAASRALAEAVTPLQVEGGTTLVTLTASGSVEIE
ncbi:MAG: SIMPL domain-containing protein [Burkholderiales bacterium]|nr:SIMPL domain-containing protein [Burkholderiales bacterium]